MGFSTLLRYPDPIDQIFKSVILVISLVVREPTYTIADSNVEPVSKESEKEGVVSLSTTEKSKMTQLKLES